MTDSPTNFDPEDVAPNVLRDVISICRAMGTGEEDVDFEFARDVIQASSYPAYMYTAIACRLFANLAEFLPGVTMDQILDELLQAQEENG